MSDEKRERGLDNEENTEAPHSERPIPDSVEAPSANATVDNQVFELPCGVLLENGKLLKEVELSPLTSGDRKMVMDGKIRRNGAKMVTTVLMRRIVRLDQTPPIESVLHRMLSGDRDFCVLKIGEMSIGKIITLAAQCPSCQSDLDISLNTDEVEVRCMTDEEQERIDEKQRRYYDIEVAGGTARFIYPTGEMNEKIGEIIRTNPVEAEFKLIAMMNTSWKGGKPLSIIQVESLPIPVLDQIEQGLIKMAKGPDLTPIMRCDNCNAETRLQVDLTDFLFRRQLRRPNLQVR